MKKYARPKLKVMNDPVHGFINIPNQLIYEIIQHRYFQRLRRISQTGLTELVYPGAKHSRFHHALGCMYLMQKALNVLKRKGIEITPEEENGALVAILLHDLGHGPYSHSLENTIIEGAHHEEISLRLMEKLNEEFEGELTLAISIFKGEYPKAFLTQLVSSQLDVDRLDYLKRDSFYTGVVEGNINPDRIISMMNVAENQLVIEAKGIHSVEKFLMARLFMYSQVYFHKKSFAAETYLIQTLKRAKELASVGETLFASPALHYFLYKPDQEQGLSEEGLEIFSRLDDSDVLSAIKEWQYHADTILRKLACSIVERKLPKTTITEKPISLNQLEAEKEKIMKKWGVSNADYFVQQEKVTFFAYDAQHYPITILYKNGRVKEISTSEKSLLTQYLQQPYIKWHIHTLT